MTDWDGEEFVKESDVTAGGFGGGCCGVTEEMERGFAACTKCGKRHLVTTDCQGEARGLLVGLAVAMAVMLVTGCDQNNTAKKEQKQTEANQERLLKVQPPMKLDWSLERDNINKRTELWNDKNKVAYIYLVSYGKVMAFFTIKGKVTSVNSQITNPSQLVHAYSGGGNRHVMPSPAEDGSYGTNGDAVYFFTTDGTYVEWAGEYMLCDKPLKLATPPQIVRAIK
jgi:hypothetical protein